jgi:hypothetical protein
MMRFVSVFAVIAMLFVFGSSRPAVADQQFFNAFNDEYIKTHSDKKYAEMVQKEAKCLVCHQGTKSRKNRNAFGNEVGKLLDRKKDANDRDKIVAALKTALALHVDPKNDKSDTYLDRVKSSKLPAGELAELKKEPAQDAAN